MIFRRGRTTQTGPRAGRGRWQLGGVRPATEGRGRRGQASGLVPASRYAVGRVRRAGRTTEVPAAGRTRPAAGARQSGSSHTPRHGWHVDWLPLCWRLPAPCRAPGFAGGGGHHAHCRARRAPVQGQEGTRGWPWHGRHAGLAGSSSLPGPPPSVRQRPWPDTARRPGLCARATTGRYRPGAIGAATASGRGGGRQTRAGRQCGGLCIVWQPCRAVK